MSEISSPKEIYRIKETIFSDTVSVTYSAQCRYSGGSVIVKAYRKSFFPSLETVQLLRNEAKILANIKHESILQIIEQFESDDILYNVFENYIGTSLLNIIRNNGPYREFKMQPLFKQIVEAIFFLHSSDIAHCMICPENILVNGEGKVKITNFINAKTNGSSVVSSDYSGSYLFAPTEYLCVKSFYPSFADIWALGMTLYVCIMGSHPYGNAQMHELPLIAGKMPPKKTKEMSEMLHNLISKCLEPNQTKRFSSSQVIVHLWLNSKSTQSRPRLMSGTFSNISHNLSKDYPNKIHSNPSSTSNKIMKISSLGSIGLTPPSSYQKPTRSSLLSPALEPIGESFVSLE